MLDVHDPHETVHTWKDFFIHIATIVVGLVIAVGLEQMVVAIHHHHQRHQLREDLRTEAEQRIERLRSNGKINANDVAWYREVLRAGHEAPVSGGFVTFTLPPKTRMGYIAVTPNGVWPAATASGAVAVLSRNEIELWADVNSFTALTAKSFDGREDSLRAVFAITDRTGIRVDAGSTLRLTPADRDDLMRAVANLLEDTWMLERNDALWQGACEAMLQGAKTPDDLIAYEGRAVAAMPK